MLFWILWAASLLGVGLAFILSVRLYVESRSVRSAVSRGPRVVLPEPRIVALQAQFLLAPNKAMAELQELLGESGIQLAAAPGDATAFSRLLRRLQQEPARAPHDPGGLGRPPSRTRS